MNNPNIVNRVVFSLFEQFGAIQQGHFKLSSGLHSDTYIQCAKILQHPRVSQGLYKILARNIIGTFGDDFTKIVSPAIGGIVVGSGLSYCLNRPSIFCERVDGKFTLRRGFELNKGDRVLIVEDVVTTGKSSLETKDCIESYGATVIGEASLVNRNLVNPLPFPLVSLLRLDVKTYEEDKLPNHLKNIPAVKPGSRDLL